MLVVMSDSLISKTPPLGSHSLSSSLFLFYFILFHVVESCRLLFSYVVNQGVNPRDTRRVELVRYKRQTLDEGRVSFTWVELKNDENVKSMFWQYNMFQWIDMRVTLLKSTEDIIKSLIPPEDSD